ncbi:hypothetical protein [Bacteroides thetaiotaomicron]|uniref:hypothetical protein n=1 Tax=Bacteroides thetaiotaomicron TaxID=818 RepID=UPI0039C0B071
MGQPTDQPARHPTVPTAGQLQNKTTYQAANGTNNRPTIPATDTSAIPPGNHTDAQRTIRTMRCMTNQPLHAKAVPLAPRSVKSLSSAPVSPFLCRII